MILYIVMPRGERLGKRVSAKLSLDGGPVFGYIEIKDRTRLFQQETIATQYVRPVDPRGRASFAFSVFGVKSGQFFDNEIGPGPPEAREGFRTGQTPGRGATDRTPAGRRVAERQVRPAPRPGVKREYILHPC